MSGIKTIFKGRKGNYVLCNTDTLGTGQFGNVFKVKDSSSNYYAVKVLNTKSYTEDSLKYMHSELDILDKLATQPDHPNVIKFYERTSENDLVFELCSGGNLLNYLQTGPYIEDKENFLKIILSQLVNGLNYLHLLEIVHRDIKPANILVNYIAGKMVVKISDFGLASCNQMDVLKSNVGTPIFKAPEVGGDSYDHKVDICSLGKTIYSLSMPRSELIRDNFSLDPEEIKKLKKSDEYKDLLIKMVDPKTSSRISLDEMKDHPFLTSRYVNLKFYPQTSKFSNRTINVEIAKKICLENKLDDMDLKDYIVLCSYYGTKELLPFSGDNLFNPIYTIESVFLVSLNDKIQFPLTPFINGKDIHGDPILNQKSKVDDCLSIINYTTFKNEFFLIYKAIYKLYLLKKDSLNIKSIFKNLLEDIEKYKSSFNLIRTLKEVDSNGNDTNRLLINQLSPFIQNFINNTSILNYEEFTKNQQLIENQMYKDLNDLQNAFKTPVMDFVIYDSFLLTQKIRKTFDKAPIILNENDNQIIHRIFTSFTPIYSSCIEHKSKFDLNLKNFNFLIDHCKKIELLDDFKLRSLNRDYELCLEISKIPQYYLLTKNELKRRSHWKSEFTKACSQYASKLQTFIDKDQSSRIQYNKTIQNSDLLKQFDQNEIIINPLEQYLPNQHNDEIDGFVVIERKKIDIENQNLNRQIDDIQEKIEKQRLLYQNQQNNNISNFEKENEIVNSKLEKEKLNNELIEKKKMLGNLVIENNRLKNEIKLYREKETINNELEEKYNQLSNHLEFLSQKYQEMKKQVQEFTANGEDGDLIDDFENLNETISQKKQDITELHQKKESLEQYIKAFEGRQGELNQSLEISKVTIESSKKSITEFRKEIKALKENESAQQNFFNHAFSQEREKFQKLSSQKNDIIRRLKANIQEAQKQLDAKTYNAEEKFNFEAVQKKLNEKDIEIDTLISQINILERLAKQ